MISFSDNGHGMSRDTMDNIFEPFFTTKDQGKGTGMGLAMLYGVVKQNKGFINVYSELKIGSVFRIYLPRYSGDEKIETVEKAPKQYHGGNELVLFVEDEISNLKLGRLMLESLGYRVIISPSPIEAIKIAEQTEGKIDLLVTDVIMPEMNGKRLSEKIISLHPETRVIFISGYTANVILHNGILDEGITLLAKPYSMQELSRKIREVLDR
jgi:CheY-like chemotaxis protein